MTQDLPLTGDLKKLYLSEILQHLQSTLSTGMLTLEQNHQVKTIYFKEGTIVSASSNLETDRLGEMLMKAGKLSQDQYQQSVERLKTTGKRQGAALVELGFLTPKELFEGLKYQVQEILYSLFLWNEGSYRYAPGELPRRLIPLEIDLVTFISEAIKRVERDQAV